MHCDVTIASDRARFRVPELLRGLPDPLMSARLVDVVGLARARYLFFTAGRDRRRRGRARWAWSARSCPTTSSMPAPSGSSSRSAAPVPRRAPTVKRDLNAQLRPGDVSLFMVPGLSAEITEGMGAFVEKRAAVWPRP